jgi:MauM/NapG family ferredoxin protein
MNMGRISWKLCRRAAQVVFLLLFLWLFRKTEYTGVAPIPSAANVLFRLDPLVAATVTAAGKWTLSLVWPALILVALTVVLGRFFCGWVCPLGTLLDAAHRAIRPGPRTPGPRWQMAKYVLLGVILAGAVFQLPLVGYLNPFAILVRGLTFAVDPLWSRGVTGLFDWLYQHAPPAVTIVSEPVFAFLKNTVLPFQSGTFLLAGVSLAILLAVFALERFDRRFWCRYLCPSGALLALLARRSLVRRLPVRACKGCATCSDICRMGAFDAESHLAPEACNLCMDCIEACPEDRVKFVVRKAKPVLAPLDPSRRVFLGTLATGLALPAVAAAARMNRRTHPYLIRPPGALDEQRFVDACVRCGECMKVCPTNALQPALFEAGVEGIFSPRLVPRMGYCEFNCTLCGELCPSGAIRRLSVPEKHRTVIGIAEFDKDRCLPFAKGKSCIVCEEHCPVPDKAIKFREAEAKTEQGEKVVVKQPYVERDLCIGCGICETKCPLPGPSAIRVSRPEAVVSSARAVG